MKKLMMVAALALVASAAQAAVTAAVTLSEDGARLNATVRIQGLEAGQAVQYQFRWTATALAYEHKKRDGTVETTRLFQDSTYPETESLTAGVANVSWRCFCKDTGEKGCWRTRAYRTIMTTAGKDKHEVRGTGTWKCEVLNAADGSILGSATHDVQ
jgi:methionine-rich copper-binding protein CopC